MEGKLPEKKMPEFKIGMEQTDELRTVSAVTKILAENPALAQEIADIFKQVAMEKERELIERVTNLLAEKVTEVPADKIKAAFYIWYIWYFPPEPKFHLYYFPPRAPWR